MKRTRVRLSAADCMKFSARCSKPLARDWAVSRLRRLYALKPDHVSMCAL